MCAYFFAATRTIDKSAVVLTSDEQKELNELKEIVTKPKMLDLARKLSKQNTGEDAHKFSATKLHLELVKNCTKIVSEKLEDVMAADKEAVAFFALGVASQYVLPFSWIISPLAFMYSGYMIYERIPALAAYTEALETLRNCAAWALNNHDLSKEIMELPEIDRMLTLLQQVMTNKQLEKVIFNGPLEDNFFANCMISEGLMVEREKQALLKTGPWTAQEYQDAKAIFNQALSESDTNKEKTLGYQVYGYDQAGSLKALAEKILTYIKDGVTDLASQGYEMVSGASFYWPR